MLNSRILTTSVGTLALSFSLAGLASSADAATCSGSASLGVELLEFGTTNAACESGDACDVGDRVTYLLSATNTSRITATTTFVDSKLGGDTCVDKGGAGFACFASNAACTVATEAVDCETFVKVDLALNVSDQPLAGTFVYSPADAEHDARGCLPSTVAQVDRCELDAADVTGNTVLVVLKGGASNAIATPPNTPVAFASFVTTATEPVSTPVSGDYGVTADGIAPPNELNGVARIGSTADTDCTPQVAWNASGDTSGFFPLDCFVRVDKQVSCDGGDTWEDATGLVLDNEDGTNSPCFGWNAFDSMDAENILVRYQASNVGNADLTSCTLSDDNTGIPAVVGFPTAILVGETTTFSQTQAACSDTLDALEPDTATVSCECIAAPTNRMAEASDQADFECLTPGLNVDKECIDNDQDGTDDRVSIMVTNAGDAPLENCVVTDTLDLNEGLLDPACNAATALLGDGFTPGPTQDVPVADIASLAAMATETVTGTITPELTQNACNLGSVTCTISNSGGKTITKADEAPCIVEKICDVQVDKQIDAGVGFVDVSDFCDETLDPDADEGQCVGGPDAGDPCDPDDATSCRTIEEAIGWNGEPVSIKFVVKNTGEARARCTVTDNKIPGLIIDSVIIPAGQMQMVTVNETCRAELEPSDTATLSCACLDAEDEATDDTVSDGDTVAIDCQTPEVSIEKLCAEQVDDVNVVTICPGLDPDECKNTGDATLINCEVSDPLCAQTFAVGTLLPDDTYGPFNCNVPGLTENTDNTATITCNISDDGTAGGDPVIDPSTNQPKQVTDSDTDECEVGDECLTRTPGFWCTHPTVTDLFLDVNVCGLPLTNVQVATVGSAIENMNFGNDHKASTSPQLLQLVRQCTAAALNQSASLGNDGDCRSAPIGMSSFGAVFDACCSASFCTAGTSASAITASGCIEKLDQFNNSEDTFADAPPPFDNLGTAMCPVPDPNQPLLTNACSAQPARCNEANGNGFVNPPYRNSGGTGGNGPPGQSKKK